MDERTVEEFAAEITKHTSLWMALTEENLDGVNGVLALLLKNLDLGNLEGAKAWAAQIKGHLTISRHSAVWLRRVLAGIPIAAAEGRPLGQVLDEMPVSRAIDELSAEVRAMAINSGVDAMFPPGKRARRKERNDRAQALAAELKDLHNKSDATIVKQVADNADRGSAR